MLIRVGDEVEVIAGDDRGERGKVLAINNKKNRVTVEGINRVYKHMRKSQRNPQGGRLSKEMSVSVSNVMIIDPQSQKPSRVGIRLLADGTKERYAKKSGASMGQIGMTKKSRAKA
jgi:large subunit ribosomal protein L24